MLRPRRRPGGEFTVVTTGRNRGERRVGASCGRPSGDVARHVRRAARQAGSRTASRTAEQGPAGPRRAQERRVFLWTFLAVQALFLLWILPGSALLAPGDCGTLDAESCEAATAVGTGIGVFMIIVFWMMVDFLLAVGYGIYRLARRP